MGSNAEDVSCARSVGRTCGKWWQCIPFFGWQIHLHPDRLNRPKIPPDSIHAEDFLGDGRPHYPYDSSRMSPDDSRGEQTPPKYRKVRRRMGGKSTTSEFQKEGGPSHSISHRHYRSQMHQHGFNNLEVFLLLIQSWIMWGFIFMLFAIGTTGGLSETVNSQFVLASFPSLISINLGLYLFLFGRRLDPESNWVLMLATLYFLCETAKFCADYNNVYRFFTQVTENDQWYMLLTSRDLPYVDPSDHTIHTGDDAGHEECLTFIHHLKHGHCGKPHSILAIFMIAMFTTGSISLYIISTMLWTSSKISCYLEKYALSGIRSDDDDSGVDEMDTQGPNGTKSSTEVHQEQQHRDPYSVPRNLPDRFAHEPIVQHTTMIPPPQQYMPESATGPWTPDTSGFLSFHEGHGNLVYMDPLGTDQRQQAPPPEVPTPTPVPVHRPNERRIPLFDQLPHGDRGEVMIDMRTEGVDVMKMLEHNFELSDAMHGRKGRNTSLPPMIDDDDDDDDDDDYDD